MFRGLGAAHGLGQGRTRLNEIGGQAGVAGTEFLDAGLLLLPLGRPLRLGGVEARGELVSGGEGGGAFAFGLPAGPFVFGGLVGGRTRPLVGLGNPPYGLFLGRISRSYRLIARVTGRTRGAPRLGDLLLGLRDGLVALLLGVPHRGTGLGRVGAGVLGLGLDLPDPAQHPALQRPDPVEHLAQKPVQPHQLRKLTIEERGDLPLRRGHHSIDSCPAGQRSLLLTPPPSLRRTVITRSSPAPPRRWKR